MCVCVCGCDVYNVSECHCVSVHFLLRSPEGIKIYIDIQKCLNFVVQRRKIYTQTMLLHVTLIKNWKDTSQQTEIPSETFNMS